MPEARQFISQKQVKNLEEDLASKVEAVAGKGLSTNDYTTSDKTKLTNLQNITGIGDNLTLTDGVLSADAQEVKLYATTGQNTDGAMTQKATTDALAGKVDSESGKGLSTNDYTTAEKNKLAGIASGAEVNVQADWNQADTSADDYIKNKPVIPESAKLYSTTGQHTDGAMTQKATTDALALKANTADLSAVATSGSYADLTNTPTIPTKTSDLTNDSDFVSDADYVHTDNNFDDEAVNKLSGIEEGAEVNLPNTVTDANYVHTDNNYTNAEKTKLSGIAAGAEVNVQPDWNETDTTQDSFIKNKPTIPDAAILYSSTGQHTDGAMTQKATTDALAEKADISALAEVATSGDYGDLLNTPTIPTKTSDLTNDSDFQNETQVDAAISAAVTASTAQIDTKLDKTVMTDFTVDTTPSTTTITLDKAKQNILSGATSSASVALPVASVSQAGVMNSATFSAIQTNSNNIDLILNGNVAINNLPEEPTQAQLTNAWKTATGIADLVNGAKIYDVTNEKTWTYYSNTSTWYPAGAGGSVTVSQWTNTSAGIVKGSTEDGQIFAENDGTGSVNGWDASQSAIASNTSNIALLQTAVADKVDKVDGKGLSTNDYTTAEKTKLAGIPAGAEANVQSDWNQTDTTADDYIKNKPVIPEGSILYDTTGQHTDGAMTQKATTDALAGKVDVVSGKGLSTNDYTTAEKTKLAGIEDGAQVNDPDIFFCTFGTTTYQQIAEAVANGKIPVVQTETDIVYYCKTQNSTHYFFDFVNASTSTITVDSSNQWAYSQKTLEDTANKVTNWSATTTDTHYPSEKLVKTALDAKVDSVSGKGLSTNDYTTAEKNKLAGIAAGAEVNVQSNWTQTNTSADDYIKNKPSIPTKISDLTDDSDFVSDANYVHTDNNYTTTEKNKLSGIAAGAEVNVQSDWNATSGDAFIKNKPTIPAAQVNSDWNATSGVARILNKPTLATVATSGSYTDLSNKPTIPTVNDATLTIQRNGSSVQTFTANSSSNKTANIQCITSNNVLSTESVTPIVTTQLIVDNAVTVSKIDVASLKSAIVDMIYPVGAILMSATLSTVAQVQTKFGGTWQAWGAGRVPVGVDTSQTEFSTVGKTGGEKTHTLTTSEMPAHEHEIRYKQNGGAGNWGNAIALDNGNKTYKIEFSSSTGNGRSTSQGDILAYTTGGDGAHNNLQPYITCYMYKRTA